MANARSQRCHKVNGEGDYQQAERDGRVGRDDDDWAQVNMGDDYMLRHYLDDIVVVTKNPMQYFL